ncbi:MAG TPA: hypothetical protein VEI03_01730 [Stellaceae bacterium]|nr:hypothetical protein [Stellaceae bacterium]
MMRSPRFRTVLLCLLALSAAGCSGGGKSVGKLTCPTAFIAPNLDSYAVYRPGVTTSNKPEDISFGVKLVNVKSNCRTEVGGVRVTTALTFLAVRGDLDFRQGDFDYFVAIADVRETILAKQNFALRVEFAPRQKQMRVLDEITEHLPLKDVSTGNTYAVIVGLQVSQQQLDLNRVRQ